MNLLTTAQVAELLGITTDGVRALIRRGKLKAQKMGRDLFVVRADAEWAKKRPGRGRPRVKTT